MPGDGSPAIGLGLGVLGRHGGAVPPPGGHELRQLRPRGAHVLGHAHPGEWPLNPSPRFAIFVTALILREI